MEEKIFNRTKALFTTRLLVFLDRYKEDCTAQLVAQSIKDAVEIFHADYGVDWMQRDKERETIDRIKGLLLKYL